MQQPFVTVGIPAYNAENFIGLAITSVLNQTYTDFELIITDDGSSDKTLEIVRSFRDSRIMVVSDGQNRGISYRLNQQIEMAKGKYFARMDADDIMFVDRLERQIAYLEAHKDVDIIGGGAYIIDDENNIIGKRVRESEIIITPDSWYNGASFIHPTVTGKIEYFRKYGYSDELKGVEDQNLWFRSSLESKLVDLPEIVMFYRDPLKFKLKTYLFRRRQNRKQWRKRELIERLGRYKCLKGICLSYYKQVVVISIKLIGLQSKLLSKRNTVIGATETSSALKVFEKSISYKNI